MFVTINYFRHFLYSHTIWYKFHNYISIINSELIFWAQFIRLLYNQEFIPGKWKLSEEGDVFAK